MADTKVLRAKYLIAPTMPSINTSAARRKMAVPKKRSGTPATKMAVNATNWINIAAADATIRCARKARTVAGDFRFGNHIAELSLVLVPARFLPII